MAVPVLAYSGFLWVVIASREKAKPNTSIAPAIAINGILGTRLEERVLGGCSIERGVPEKAAGWQACSPLFEIAHVLVRFATVSSCERRKLTAFLELEAAIRAATQIP